MSAIICLAENSYWKGVCALANAAFSHLFEGVIYVGYRGSLPDWLTQLKRDNGDYVINDKLILKAILLDTHRHLGFEKVFFINKIIKDFSIDIFFFFDTDCVPIAGYDFYKDWSNEHIAVCEDECYTQLHENHPWKNNWKKILRQNNFKDLYFNHPYINSGFLSVPKKYFVLIERWLALTQALEKNGFNSDNFNKSPLLSIQGDQEILNMALMTFSTESLSVIGREAMGFKDPIFLMVHCTSSKKPWVKNFTSEFIKSGVQVSAREKIYVKYLNSHFNCMSQLRFLLLKTDIFVASLLSRIF